VVRFIFRPLHFRYSAWLNTEQPPVCRSTISECTCKCYEKLVEESWHFLTTCETVKTGERHYTSDLVYSVNGWNCVHVWFLCEMYLSVVKAIYNYLSAYLTYLVSISPSMYLPTYQSIYLFVSKYSVDEIDRARNKHGGEVHTNVPYQNLKKRGNCKNQCVDWRIILKRKIKKRDGKVRSTFMCFTVGPMAVSSNTIINLWVPWSVAEFEWVGK
jgi:hypothetical protein